MKLAEYGGRPLFYFHSTFVTTKKNWMGDEDIRYETDQDLAAGVAAIKTGVDDYNTRSYLQTEFMEEHELLATDVSRTTYSDGSEIIANYSNDDLVYEGRNVKSLRYILVD